MLQLPFSGRGLPRRRRLKQNHGKRAGEKEKGEFSLQPPPGEDLALSKILLIFPEAYMLPLEAQCKPPSNLGASQNQGGTQSHSTSKLTGEPHKLWSRMAPPPLRTT